MRARAWIAPAALAVLTAASSTLALRQPETPRSRLAGLPEPAAPVLSLRRAPELLARAVGDAKLATQLDAAVRAAPASTCLVVRSPEGRMLYSRNPDQPLIPASNLKILLALALLTKLGPDETLVTTAVSAQPLQPDGTLPGPLYLVGGGDPLLETADYAATLRFKPTIRTPYERLADDLVAKGLKRVAGGVMGDDSRHDRQRYIPTWKPSYAAQGQVGPQSALLVNDGFALIQPRWVAAPNPPQHAAAVLTELLKSRGVLIEGPPGQSQAPAGAATISELRSPPVRDLVAEMLQESDNTTAEVLLKELGRRTSGQGTTAAGIEAMRAALAQAGLAVDPALKAVDGSGLDRGNRASCGLLAQALSTGPPDGPLQDGLPVAAREGTLTDRFQNHPAAGRLRAKTGSLSGVAGLSGLVDTAGTGGPATLSFALLANELPTDAAGRALQEAVGAVLVRYPDAPPPDQLDPER